MCRLMDAIDHQIAAADGLTRACAREGAIADAAATGNVFVMSLKKSFRASAMTPNDMLHTLGKLNK